eukprot:2339797-Lingulodinium_polyedra.AAC.1
MLDRDERQWFRAAKLISDRARHELPLAGERGDIQPWGNKNGEGHADRLHLPAMGYTRTW